MMLSNEPQRSMTYRKGQGAAEAKSTDPEMKASAEVLEGKGKGKRTIRLRRGSACGAAMSSTAGGSRGKVAAVSWSSPPGCLFSSLAPKFETETSGDRCAVTCVSLCVWFALSFN